MDHWRLRIGKIAPTIWDNSAEYDTLTPEGVEVVAVTLGLEDYDRDDLTAARERRAEAARLLDRWDVDCVIAGGGPVATIAGVDAEDRFIESMRETLDAEFTTAFQAQLDAFDALGVSSLLLVSPFPAARDRETAAQLDARGLSVVATGGVEVSNPRETRAIERHVCYRTAMELARSVEEPFDAIYVPGGPFGSVAHIDRLESDTGRPVVMSVQAQLWHAYRLCGIDPGIEGYGQLFRVD